MISLNKLPGEAFAFLAVVVVRVCVCVCGSCCHFDIGLMKNAARNN